jgi:hypothetical protein
MLRSKIKLIAEDENEKPRKGGELPQAPDEGRSAKSVTSPPCLRQSGSTFGAYSVLIDIRDRWLQHKLSPNGFMAAFYNLLCLPQVLENQVHSREETGVRSSPEAENIVKKKTELTGGLGRDAAEPDGMDYIFWSISGQVDVLLRGV